MAVRGEHRATVRLEDGEVLAGHLPAKLHRSVRRLLAEHRDEAYEAWEATRRQEPPKACREEVLRPMEAIDDVPAVRVLSRYVVELTFETGEVRVLDLERVA